MLNILRVVNKSLADDDWITDRYYVKMIKEYWDNRNRSCQWGLIFIDRLNPLNTCMSISETLYYSDIRTNDLDRSGNIVGCRFAKTDIYLTLNSWLQLCENGYVSDSPSHVGMYTYYDQRESILRHHTTTAKLTKEKYQLIKNKIENFDLDRSLYFNKKIYHEKTNYDYKIFSPLTYLYLYKENCMFEMDENGEIDYGLVQFDNKVYFLLAERDTIYDPRKFRNKPSIIAYEINLDEMDTEKTLTLYAKLNNIKLWSKNNGSSSRLWI